MGIRAICIVLTGLLLCLFWECGLICIVCSAAGTGLCIMVPVPVLEQSGRFSGSILNFIVSTGLFWCLFWCLFGDLDRAGLAPMYGTGPDFYCINRADLVPAVLGICMRPYACMRLDLHCPNRSGLVPVWGCGATCTVLSGLPWCLFWGCGLICTLRPGASYIFWCQRLVWSMRVDFHRPYRAFWCLFWCLFVHLNPDLAQ